MMTEPLVSVIIPTYNNADTIGRAIKSVIRQGVSDWQLLVIDDESTDATRTVIQGYRTVLGPRLVYIRQQHAGGSAARNAGIERAAGRFIAFLDADDEFLSDKLSRQLELFSRCPQLGMVFCDMAYVDLSGALHETVLHNDVPAVRAFSRRAVGPKLYACGADFLDVMIGRYIVPTITAMVRREILYGGVRFRVDHSYSEEWLFFLDVVSRCEAGFVDEPLALQHHRRKSLSRTSTTANVWNQIRVLEQITARYPQASSKARAEINAQLAHYCRQMAMDLSKSGRFGDALSHFAAALRHKRSPRTVTDVVRAFVDVCVHGSGKRSGKVEHTREPVA